MKEKKGKKRKAGKNWLESACPLLSGKAQRPTFFLTHWHEIVSTDSVLSHMQRNLKQNIHLHDGYFAARFLGTAPQVRVCLNKTFKHLLNFCSVGTLYTQNQINAAELPDSSTHSGIMKCSPEASSSNLQPNSQYQDAKSTRHFQNQGASNILLSMCYSQQYRRKGQRQKAELPLFRAFYL